ncbi:MAG: 1-deoxy-D-xylulose-5-phosphate synthase, partial [Sphingobacteriales bacterium]
IDVGIAEQHAVTVSAGLATQGLKVFCNIYSSFMQRAYDMVVHDVAIQKLPVVFCLDRAGLVGEDGPTHHGCYDIAYMRCIPNLIVSAPMNEKELRNLMYTAQLDSLKLPIVIRYPRGEGVFPDLQKDNMAAKYPFEEIIIGKGRKLKDGEQVAILSFGHPGNFAAAAIRDVRVDGINPAHYDMRFAKPLDEEMLHEVFAKFKKIITVEDGTVVGGFGSAILEFMNAHGYKSDVKVMGIPDRLVEHGSVKELYHEINLDAASIAQELRAMANVKVLVK